MSDPTSLHIIIEVLSIATVTAISYVSINFDNRVVLSTDGAKLGYQPLWVNLTYPMVCLPVLLASPTLALAADALPPEAIRYLGPLLIGFGCYHFVRLSRDRAAGDALRQSDAPDPIGLSAYIGFALALLANGSDSISVITPILAEMQPGFVVACFVADVAMAVFMNVLADNLARHPGSKPSFEKLDKWVLPCLLLGIGILIFKNTPSNIFVA